MSTNSAIEWTDTTWNPVVGCKMVSPGCANCYAETMAKRLAAMAQADIDAGKNPGRKARYLNVINDKGRWAGNVVTVPEALADPLGWRKPRRVFVNSMSDLFHADVPFDFIDRVFAVMALTPQHTYQVLTKRPERMAEYLNDRDRVQGVQHAIIDTPGGDEKVHRAWFLGFPDWTGWPLPNVWLGTSVENQAAADERIPHLLRCPAAVRFLSCEPLLGPVDLKRIGKTTRGDDHDALAGWRGSYQYKARNDSECSIGVSWSNGHPRIDWVIVGGESGHGARPFDVSWARSIVSQCQAAGVACFVKQLGAVATIGIASGAHYLPLKDTKGGNPDEWPTDLRVRQFPQEAARA